MKWQCRPFNNITWMKAPSTSAHSSYCRAFLSSFKSRVTNVPSLLANVAKNARRMLMIALKRSRVGTVVVLYTSNLKKGCMTWPSGCQWGYDNKMAYYVAQIAKMNGGPPPVVKVYRFSRNLTRLKYRLHQKCRLNKQ